MRISDTMGGLRRNVVCGLIFFYVVGFFFSTLLTSIFSILLGLAWLIDKQYSYLPAVIKSQPLVAVGAALSLCFLIAVFYSAAPQDLAVSGFNKYRKFLYIPVLMILFRDESHRKWCWAGFLVASVLTLVFSYLKAGGILNLNHHNTSATIKNHISHSIFVAFFAFYCLHKTKEIGRCRCLYLLLFALCLHNLFFMVHGRTGQVIVLLLITLFACQHGSKKWILTTLLLLTVAIGGYLKFSDKAGRINMGIESTVGYLKDPHLAGKYTDLGVRYALWQYSAELIGESPVIGFGTGSFNTELKRIAKGHIELLRFDHPHNEFFMIGVELGMTGLMLYCGFYWALYHQLARMSPENRLLGQGVFIALLVTSLFNTPIYDHAQGNFFVTLIALCFLPNNTLFNANGSDA